MTDAMISYAREDAPAARALAELLEEAGLSVWWDADLPAGIAFADEIRRRIEEADKVIVLWSGRSVSSEWVRAEADEARQKDKLFPVRIEECLLPLPFTVRNTLDIYWNKEKEIFSDISSLFEYIEIRQRDSQVSGELIDDQSLSATSLELITKLVMRKHSIDEIRKAAATGDARALLLLGFWLSEGVGINENPEEGFSHLATAMELGLSRAKDTVAISYLTGRGVAKDVSRAVELVKAAAEDGVAIAQYRLGSWSEHGTNIEKNPEAAFKWYQRAAVAGSAEAQDALGWCYHRGVGVKRDLREAMHWFERGAEGGYGRSYAMLAAIHADGIEVPRDLKKAAELFQAAYRAGHAESATSLGVVYSRDFDPSQPREAIKWYRLADNGEASLAIANLVIQGNGTLDDLADVRYELAKAADAGYDEALLTLGELAATGRYGPQDFQLAAQALTSCMTSEKVSHDVKRRAQQASAQLGNDAGGARPSKTTGGLLGRLASIFR